MKDWNVVVTVFDEEGYRLAMRALPEFGRVGQTGYYNVLVMKVADVDAFTAAIAAFFDETPGYMNLISRVVPAQATFDFQTPEEFEEKAEAAVLGWADRLADKAFYVRLHRRGFKGRIVSPEEERAIDGAILRRLETTGHGGRIDFENPDMVIDIETVGNRAGLSIWTRDQLEELPFLHID